MRCSMPNLPLIVGGRFGINPAVTKPLVELVELTGAVYRDDNGIIAFPPRIRRTATRRPRDRQGSRRRDGDRLPRSREPARQLHRAQGERRLRPPARRPQGHRHVAQRHVAELVVLLLRGPAPLVDVQINCDPLFGMQQLNAVIRAAAGEGRRRARQGRRSARRSRTSATRRSAPARPRTRARAGTTSRSVRAAWSPSCGTR